MQLTMIYTTKGLDLARRHELTRLVLFLLHSLFISDSPFEEKVGVVLAAKNISVAKYLAVKLAIRIGSGITPTIAYDPPVDQ